MSDLAIPKEMLVVHDEKPTGSGIFVLVKIGGRYQKVRVANANAWLDSSTGDWKVNLTVTQYDRMQAEDWNP